MSHYNKNFDLSKFTRDSNTRTASGAFAIRNKSSIGTRREDCQNQWYQTIKPEHSDSSVADLLDRLVAKGLLNLPTKKDTSVPTDVVKKVDLLDPASLRVKQPGLISKLYSGMQCSNCSDRFKHNESKEYSAHLDWHFRQNRRERDAKRRAYSRPWHYVRSDWLHSEQHEDPKDKAHIWFEIAGKVAKKTPEIHKVPSVACVGPMQQHCALCGDIFHAFYNDEEEEWQLRNAVRYEGKNFHPLCCDDYKASLTKKVKQEEDVMGSPAIPQIEKYSNSEVIVIDSDDDH